MRVIVFSRVRLFAEALASCIATLPCRMDVQCSHRLHELNAQLARCAPDLVLFDVATEAAINDARVLKQNHPRTRLLALALPEIADRVIACADAGFVGYVPRDASIQELIEAMQTSSRNEMVCSPRVTHALFQEMRRRKSVRMPTKPENPLTPREQEVTQCLLRGLSNKAIARELHLSEATIKNHLHSVFVKLDVHKRTEAVTLLRDEPWLAESA